MSVKKKPLVVVTRKLPDSIETRMRELFDARLNLDDTPLTPEQLAEAARSADILVPTATGCGRACTFCNSSAWMCSSWRLA